MKEDSIPNEKNNTIFAIDLTKITATVLQYSINAFQERSASNVKSMIESGKLFHTLQNNPSGIASGFTSNLAYYCVSMFPAMKVYDHVSEKKIPQYQAAALAATVETVLGVRLDVMGFEKILKQNMGIDISKNRLGISLRVAPFYAMRNCGFWYAMKVMSSDESLEQKDENLGKKSLTMFGIGALSSIPDTGGNCVMKYDPKISIGECYLKAAKEIFKMPPKTIAAAAAVRGGSIMIGGLIFSKEFFGYVEETINSISPSSKPEAKFADKVVDAKKNEREAGS